MTTTTPFVSDSDFTLYVGDVREVLATLEDGTVDCCVTSPPYWGLRDYGTGQWEGGDPDCDHAKPTTTYNQGFNERWGQGGGQLKQEKKSEGQFSQTCGKCGAIRADRQLGLEPTPEEYVANMVAVFREVRRVLADHGTCWLNLGDSYASSTGGGERPGGGLVANRGANRDGCRVPDGLKAKDLVGIPWLVARALQEPFYAGRIAKEQDRTWLAATIDGEGTICGTVHTRKDDGRTRTMPQVFITNSSVAMLDEANRIWPAGRFEHTQPGDGHLGTADVFRWIVQGIESKTAIVRELYPYLIVKRRQALLAYNLLLLMADAKRLGKSSQAQSVRDKRELLCRLMSELNHAQAADVPSWCVEPPTLYEPGWYLRSDIIWSKPNAMPESVTDRPTKAHEYVFLLSKQPRYFFDQEAVREAYTPDDRLKRVHDHDVSGSHENHDGMTNGRERWANTGRNIRSVWEIATQPYAEAHFATFPEELARRCIVAGCPEWVCRTCGKPRERIVERTPAVVMASASDYGNGAGRNDGGRSMLVGAGAKTLGWSDCGHNNYRAGVVLDPFMGSGTTALVARKHGRHAIGVELNPEYAELCSRRNAQQTIFSEDAA